VFAAGKQGREHAEVGVAEQQPLRLATDRPCGTHNRAQMFAAGQSAKVFRADPSEVGNFVFSKSLLRGLYDDHFSCRPFMIPAIVWNTLKPEPEPTTDTFPSNHSAVHFVAAVRRALGSANVWKEKH
jgi:hypothetical protein